MKFIPRFKYAPISRTTKEDGSRTYNTPGGSSVPSVTTILSRTKDMTFLKEWKDRIGHEQAAKITKRSTTLGTGMHKLLEDYITESKPPKGNIFEVAMAKKIISNGLCNVDEIWGVEVALCAEGLYAGTTDTVGVHKGEPAIIDFKNSRSVRKPEWVADYKLQVVAYALAHDEMFNTNIRKGVVMLATQTGEYQEFVVEGTDFDEAVDTWSKRIEQYYKKYRL